MHSPLWSVIWLTEVSPEHFFRSVYPVGYDRAPDTETEESE